MSKRNNRLQTKTPARASAVTRISMGSVPPGINRMGLLGSTSIVAGMVLSGVGAGTADAAPSNSTLTNVTAFPNSHVTVQNGSTGLGGLGGYDGGVYLGSGGAERIVVGSGTGVIDNYSANGLYFSGGRFASGSVVVESGASIIGNGSLNQPGNGVVFIGGSGVSNGNAAPDGTFFGSASVYNEGDITGSAGDGVLIKWAYDVEIANSAGGDIYGTDDGIEIYSGGTQQGGDGSGIHIWNEDGSTITGDSGDGIYIHNAADVRIHNDDDSSISGSGDGIFLNYTDTVWIDNTNGSEISGEDDAGIDLYDVDNVTITNVGVDGSGSASEIYGSAEGIVIDTASIVSIHNSGGAKVTTDSSGNAIYVTSSVQVTIDNYSGSTISGGYDGIEIDDTLSDVTINNDGTIRGENSHGIHLSDWSGAAVINNYGSGSIYGEENGIVIENDVNDGSGTSMAGAVINNSGRISASQDRDSFEDYFKSAGTIVGYLSAGSVLQINNLSGGIITNEGSGGITTDAEKATGFAVNVTQSAGGYVEIYNDGHIDGRVYLTGSGDYFGNFSRNSWNVQSGNDFSGGFDVVDNSGGAINIYGDTLFANLEDIYNSGGGIIDMRKDGGQFSRFDIIASGGSAAHYYGDSAGNAEFAVDVNLSSAGVNDVWNLGGSAADLMYIGDSGGSSGTVYSGSTAVIVNDVDGSLASTYTGSGIPIVEVGSAGFLPEADAFYLKDGPIQKGLWQWDIRFAESAGDASVSGNHEWQLVMEPGEKAVELPLIMSAAQDAWFGSTGLWLDRQADLRSVVVGAGTMGGSVSTGGIWTKILGGTSNRSDDVSYDDTRSSLDYGATHVNDYAIGYEQDLFGFLAGVDFGKTASDGSTWLFGLFGGYTQANTDLDSGATADLTAGSVGGYVTYLNGGLFIDAVVKGDFGTTSYEFDDGTSYSEDIGTTTIGGVVDMGYRFGMGGSAFLEPVASLAYAYTTMDDIDIQGSDVSFEDGSDFRGRIGLRAGATMGSGDLKFEPFITGSLWQDFSDGNSASITSNGYDFAFADDGIGTYGVVDGGVNVFSGDSVSGFAKVNYTFGSDNYEALSGSVGVRVNW